MSEEESFWTLTMLIETILPLDYYSNMVGVLIDQHVFKNAVNFFFPDLYEHF
jgi:Rab-GTPase-TBC domain